MKNIHLTRFHWLYDKCVKISSVKKEAGGFTIIYGYDTVSTKLKLFLIRILKRTKTDINILDCE